MTLGTKEAILYWKHNFYMALWNQKNIYVIHFIEIFAL